MNTPAKLDTTNPRFKPRFRVFHLLAVILALLGAEGKVSAQARITNPLPGWTIPHPTFTLTWNNVSASEHFVYLGSRQGMNDYFGTSTGRNTRLSLIWQVNRPAGVWIRIWSRVRINSGFANSTWSGAEQWVFTDSYHPMAQPPVNHAPALIDNFLSTAASGRQGLTVGECKAFLQRVFDQAGRSFRLPNGASPLMPANDTRNGMVSNWQWLSHSNSGFIVVAQVPPGLNDKDKPIAVLNLLRQIRRGDVLQCVWKTRVASSGSLVSHYGPHTMAFREHYNASKLDVVHSNMDGKGSLQYGTTTVWGTITPSSLAIRIGAQMGGCTLYRVDPDVQRR